MKKYIYYHVSKQKAMIEEKPLLPRYDAPWGNDNRISHLFKWENERLFSAGVESILASDKSPYNVRFIVCYRNKTMKTQNARTLAGFIKACDDDFVIIPVKANREHNIPINEEALTYAEAYIDTVVKAVQLRKGSVRVNKLRIVA